MGSGDSCPNYQASCVTRLSANAVDAIWTPHEDFQNEIRVARIDVHWEGNVYSADTSVYHDPTTGYTDANGLTAAINAALNSTNLSVLADVYADGKADLNWSYQDESLLVPALPELFYYDADGEELTDTSVGSWDEILNYKEVQLNTQSGLVDIEFLGDGSPIVGQQGVGVFNGTAFENRPTPYGTVELNLTHSDSSCNRSFAWTYNSATGLYE